MKLFEIKKKTGQLSREDIIREIRTKKLIIAPAANSNIKAASFDISPSCLIMSARTGNFMRIYSNVSRCAKGHRNPEWHCGSCHKKGQAPMFCPEQQYVYIEPRDTALVLSREYIQLPAYISGNVYSRVSTVSAGLGHISTTIDPLWRGALLIAISNPSSKPIKLMLRDQMADSIPLATVTLQYLNTSVSPKIIHNTHQPARVDLLEKYLYDVSESKNRWVFLKKAIYRFFHAKDYNLTVRLIDRLKNMKDISPDEWAENLESMEQEIYAQKIRGKTWRKRFLGIWHWTRRLLIAGSLVLLACLIYYLVSADSTTEPVFISALIVAVVQCILTVVLTLRKE